MDKTNRNAIQSTTKVLKLSNRDAGNAAEPAPDSTVKPTDLAAGSARDTAKTAAGLGADRDAGPVAGASASPGAAIAAGPAIAEARERIARPIRSFVLREGRLTAGQERAFRELWTRFGVNWQPGETLDPQALFSGGPPDLSQPRPITLEIGFGNGESLATMAAAAPERDFIGLEVHRPGVGHLLLLLEQQGLTNVRVLRADATALLETGLPAASLDRVQLFFPDPWPKKRHHKRRIVQPSVVAAVAQVLQTGGIFHLATDWTPYADWMLTMLDNANALFENCAGPGQFSPRPAQRPLTKFERRGQRLGHQVHDLIYRRR